jgi:GntR family transcriptional regulator
MSNDAPVQFDSLVAEITLDPQRAAPLHEQLTAALRRLIREGGASVGTLLPAETDLVERLGISRHTVRHALGALVAEGLLQRRKGAGTRVVAQPPAHERSPGGFYAFASEAQARGAEHQSRLLEHTTLAAENHLASRLHLRPGAPVERITRLRTADGEPLVLETAHVPGELARALGAEVLEQETIHDALERLAGLRITHTRETIRPVLLDRPAARLLGVKPGSPAFAVERTTWAGGRPVEWQHSLVRGDCYLCSVDLPRRAAEEGA